eukprot:s1784_g11.t2
MRRVSTFTAPAIKTARSPSRVALQDSWLARSRQPALASREGRSSPALEMAAQGANNGNGASRIGDMSELLGLSKLQEVLQSLAEEQAKVDATQEKQDEKISAASTRLDTLEQGLQEVTLTLVPELQRQLENIQEQCKAVEEATRKLRDQEAQLSSQSARVALLEKQVNERLASLEGKVSGLELKGEERYTEVKLAIASVQEGQTLQAEEIKAAEAARHEALQEERRRQQEAESLRESERAQLEAQLAQQAACLRVLVSLAWPLSNALAVDQALAEPETLARIQRLPTLAPTASCLSRGCDRGRQSTLESLNLGLGTRSCWWFAFCVLYPPVKRSDWEADYVRDDMADHGQWEAQMDYDVARKQRRDMQKQAKNSMKAAVIAEEEFEDIQRALPSWKHEDIKYGKGEIKKFEKELREDAIKTVGQKIKEKEKRIEAMKHNHSPQKKAAFSAQEVQDMGDGFAVAASQEDSSKSESCTEGNAKEIPESAKTGRLIGTLDLMARRKSKIRLARSLTCYLPFGTDLAGPESSPALSPTKAEADRQKKEEAAEQRRADEQAERREQQEQEAQAAKAAKEAKEAQEAKERADAEAAAAAAKAAEASLEAAAEPEESTQPVVPTASSNPLKRLSAAQRNQHKLCKKKLKEIEGLQAQLTAKQVKYSHLSDDQKEKIKRKAELEQTVTELERLAEDLEQEAQKQEEQEQEPVVEEAPVQVEEEVAPAVEAEEEKEIEAGEAEEVQEEEDPEVAAARAAEEAAAAAAAAAAALEAEKQALEEKKQACQKQKKNTLKKIKEIDAIEAKMAERGQTFAELLPEVKEKVGRKSELLATVEEMDRTVQEIDAKLLNHGQPDCKIQAEEQEAPTKPVKNAKKPAKAAEPVRPVEVPAPAVVPAQQSEAEAAEEDAGAGDLQAADSEPSAPLQKAEATSETAAGEQSPGDEDEEEDSASKGKPRAKSKAAAKAKKKTKKSPGEKKQNDTAEIDALAASIANDAVQADKKKGLFGILGNWGLS